MTSTSPAHRWVPVAHGSLAELMVLRALLDANRIPTDLPTSTVGAMTGLFTGSGELSLHVPDACERRARALLERWPDEHRGVAERMEHGAARER